MANFASLTANLNLNISNFASNMRAASGQATTFAANLQGKMNTGIVEPAKAAKFQFKDVARIVQGILISKVFYAALNSIRTAVGAVWEFAKSLEYAKMVYSNLFGDTSLAVEFINVLKDFAAVTPFTFSQAEAAAKRLLAYGIQYKNVMYVMQGVLAASTVQQNPAAIETVSRALGQIYTKGRLMNEEMRQLAEAGIPAYEILQKKLGLTSKQLQNLGREAIPARVAINALVDGITERFGSTLAMSSLTIQGIVSNIHDNALMVFSGIFTPFTNSIKGALASFGEFMLALRTAYELRGIGGFFETLIPPAFQATIRALIVNFSNLGNIIQVISNIVSTIFKQAFVSLLNVLNMLLPVINVVLGFFAGLINMMVQNAVILKLLAGAVLICAGAWVVYRTKMILAWLATDLIKAMTWAVAGLTKAFSFLVVHPIWGMLALCVGLFIALTGTSNAFAASIRNLFSGLTSLGGVDSSKILLPETKQRAADIGKFNERLTDTGKGMDKLADKTGKATKAAQALLAFDEVFNIKTPDEAGAGGIGDNLDDLGGIGGIGGIGDMSGIFDEINFDTLTQGFVDNLIASFGGKEKLTSAAIGGIIGAIIGGILGGPLGAKIGLVVGAIAGWFWDDLAKALGLTNTGKIAIPIAAGLGAAIGGIIAGPAGAVIGLAIGLLVGWIIDSFTRGFETGDWAGIGIPIGVGLGAAIGFIIAGPAGAAIGVIIGLVIGWITDQFITGFSTGEWDTTGISLSIGTSLGAAIGFIIGGPVGLVIGGAIGYIVGWITDQFIIGFSTGKWNTSGISLSLGTGIGAAIGFCIGGPIGAIIGGAIGMLVGWITNMFIDGFSAGNWNTMGLSLSLGTGIGAAIGFCMGGPIGAIIGAAVGALVGWITGLIMDNWGAISAWFVKIGNIIGKFFVDLGNDIGRICKNIWTSVSDWFQKIYTDIALKCLLIWTVATEWFQKLCDDISTKCMNIWTTVSGWFQKIYDTINEKLSSTWTTVSEWFQKIWGTINEKLSSTWTTVSEWFQKIWDIIIEKLGLTGAWGSVKEFFGNMYDSIDTKIGDMYNTVKTGTANIYGVFKTWVTDLWTNVFNKLFGWLDTGIKKLKEIFRLDATAKETDFVGPLTTTGHAVGGIFNREHVARFAEGNKAEAIIPLENKGAMQPFVDAVSNGLYATLAPLFATMSGSSQQPIIYVGNLIADDAGLRELNKRMQVIILQESVRRG